MRYLTCYRLGQEGVALIAALFSILLLSALGLSLVLGAQTEILVAGNYRDSVEGLHAAEAGIERALHALGTVADWTEVLSSGDGVRADTTSGFADQTTAPALPGGRHVDLAVSTFMMNCARPTPCSDAAMDASSADRPWGVNNPRWRLYAWGRMDDLVQTDRANSPFYVVVWVADDQSETDGNPSADGVDPSNPGSGVLNLHAEALGPRGARKAVDATAARRSGDATVRIRSWRDVR
jgi:hypothetical protein